MYEVGMFESIKYNPDISQNSNRGATIYIGGFEQRWISVKLSNLYQWRHQSQRTITAARTKLGNGPEASA